MNVLASECSSGCESGWTPYLEHSILSSNPSHRGTEEHKEKRGKHEEEDEEEEEDLSMVSDASSGPPHFHEDDDYFNDNNGCFYPTASMVKTSGKRQKTKQHQEHPCLLDDTASSPVFNFSKNNLTLTNNQASTESILDFSQGFSTTHFEGGSAFQNHFGILQSPVWKPTSAKPVVWRKEGGDERR